MNLRFSKSVVKATAAVCIAVLLVTCACLAVFAVQSNASQSTVAVDDSAHTVDVSRDPCVKADAFRALYPEFTVLDSRGETADAKEPLRFCLLTKGGVSYTVTGVPSNYSMNNWTMDSVTYPYVWGTYSDTTTTTLEQDVYGKADSALKIAPKPADATRISGLDYWIGASKPAYTLAPGERIETVFDFALSDTAGDYYCQFMLNASGVYPVPASGSSSGPAFGIRMVNGRLYCLGVDTERTLSAEAWYSLRLSLTVGADGKSMEGVLTLDGEEVFRRAFVLSNGAAVTGFCRMNVLNSASGDFYVDNLSLRCYYAAETGMLLCNTEETRAMTDTVNKTIDFSDNTFITAAEFLAGTENALVRDDFGSDVTDDTPLRFLHVYEVGEGDTPVEYSLENIPANYSRTFWNMDSTSYPFVWGEQGTPSLSSVAGIFGKADAALKIAGGQGNTGLQYNIGNTLPAHSFSACERFEISFDIALDDVTGQYYCELKMNSGTLLEAVSGENSYRAYGLLFKNGRIFFLGTDTKVSVDEKTWHSVKISFFLEADKKTVKSVLTLDGTEIANAMFVLSDGAEITRFARMTVRNNSTGDLYIDNLSTRHFASAETGSGKPASSLISRITEAPSVDYENARLVLDYVLPDGFTLTVAESTPEVISEDGSITMPSVATDVTFRLRVTSDLDPENTAVTEPFTLHLLGNAERIAAGIDLLELPDPLGNDTKIIFPTVPEGYTVRISSTSNASLVDTDGNLYRKDKTSYVRLTFTVTETASGIGAETAELLLPVFKAYTAPNVTEAEIRRAKEDYEAMKYGMFVHYVPSTVYADKTKVVNIDDLADNFDAEQFAKDVKASGAEYLVLTVWHGCTYTLFPSVTNERWRDARSTDAAHPKTYSDRDVIADVLDALEPYGIPLHLYVHPSEGKDFSAEDKVLTGWDDATDNYGTWNRYTNELMYELCDRYGDRIAGLWIDAFFDHIPKGEAQARFRELCTANNPKMILQMNVGLRDSEHIEDPLPGHNGADYRCWEFSHTDDLEGIPLTKNQTAIVIGSQWFTDTAKDTEITISSPEEIFRYLVGQASLSRAGGFLASAGCYPNRAEDALNGDIWQKGIRETFLAVNAYLEALGEAVKNTNAGVAYPTAAGMTVKDLAFVSTESRDGSYVYIHVLNPQDSRTLSLALPADGSVFAGTAILMRADGTRAEIALTRTAEGYMLTLPEDESFGTVDTVIRLARVEDTEKDVLRVDDEDGNLRLAILGAAPTLTDSIAVTYRVKILNALLTGTPRMTFTFRGVTAEADGTLLSDDGTYGIWAFTFRGILPQFMREGISAELTVADATVRKRSYSVCDYVCRLLGKTAEELGYSEARYAALRTLLVDMLYYGADTQVYIAAKNGEVLTESELATSVLTEEQKAERSSDRTAEAESVYNRTSPAEAYAGYTWEGAALILSDRITLHFRLRLPELTGVTVKVFVGDTLVTESADFAETNVEGEYTFDFSAIGAAQLHREIRLELFKNGAPTDSTVTYSVPSYVRYAVDEEESDTLKALMRSLYAYALSAKTFASAE